MTVPFGGGGMFWTERVDASSWRVNKRSSVREQSVNKPSFSI